MGSRIRSCGAPWLSRQPWNLVRRSGFHPSLGIRRGRRWRSGRRIGERPKRSGALDAGSAIGADDPDQRVIVGSSIDPRQGRGEHARLASFRFRIASMGRRVRFRPRCGRSTRCGVGAQYERHLVHRFCARRCRADNACVPIRYKPSDFYGAPRPPSRCRLVPFSA